MGAEVETPRWFDLLKKGVDIFAPDYDAILSAMYALSVSAEGDCYLCLPPDPGIELAALGACESELSGTASAASVAVSLADPSGGPVLARSTTVLPCPAVPSSSLSGLNLPSFSTNLVSNAVLQDHWVDTFTPGGQHVAIYTCSRTGRHLATFTRAPGSSLYTLTTVSPQVAAVGQASVSGQLDSPCSCHSLSHQTVLWHHRLGHPSLPHLRDMHRRVLVSGLPRTLPPLPASPALACLPCVEGRQRAAPHSSSFPPTEAPLQTLHMDVWGPARVSGRGGERYFLLVVDDYSRYITVFPLRTKGEVPAVLIPWIRAVRLQLRRRFQTDLPVLRLHSDRGGEFAFDLLRGFCQEEGITQSYTLPGSPQQNGVAEHRIGLVMEIARTSLIHATAPHFLWPFAVRYATQQLNLWPRVSVPDTSPTLRWTGEVGDASVFRVDPPPLAEPVEVTCVSGAAEGGTARGAASRGAEPWCEVLEGEVPAGAEPVREVLEGAEPGGAEPVREVLESAEPGGAEQVREVLEGAEPGGAEPVREVLESAEPGGAEPVREVLEGAEPGRAGPEGADRFLAGPLHQRSCESGPGGARTGGTRAAEAGGSGGAAGGAAGAGAAGGAAGATGGADGAAGAGGGAAGATGVAGGAAGAAGGAAVGAASAGAAGGAAVGSGGAGGAAGAAGGASVGVAGARAPGGAAVGSGGAEPPRPYFVPLLEQALGLPPSPAPPPSIECSPPVLSPPQLQPTSPLPAPSSYAGPTGGLAERREPASRLTSHVRAARASRRSPRPPPVAGTHWMTLRPSTALQRVPLPSPPESSLPTLADPESDSLRAASPTVTCLLATVVTDPSFESAAASALVAELVDFAARCRLDYAASLLAESESVCPPSVGGECALGTDVLEDRQEEFQCLVVASPHLVSMLLAPEGDPDALDIPTPRSYAEAVEGPYSSQWQAAMDAEMASSKSTGTYVDEVPPPGANIVDDMWIFRVKRPPGSPPVFKARYVAHGFSQRQGVDYFQTFSPTPKMTTLRVLLHVAAQRDYELHSLDFSTAFLQGSLHEEIWLRRPPGFTESFPPGTQWSLPQPVYALRQAPCEWHNTLRTVRLS
ncbi:unnamed protein product [Closterium sp. NIES-64]|nr:unnamed protein product [Closterium sp. NIES-64]